MPCNLSTFTLNIHSIANRCTVPKYPDTITPYHTCAKFEQVNLYKLLMCLYTTVCICFCVDQLTTLEPPPRKHAYIVLTPLNPTFIQ